MFAKFWSAIGLETESFDSKLWISSRESFNLFLSSEFFHVNMLSEMRLKVPSESSHYHQEQPVIPFW